MPLMKRQMEIVQALQRGLTNKQIAAELGTSPATIRDYLCDAYRRTGLDRWNLIRAGIRDHELKQACRINKWVERWKDHLPPESLSEIKSILAEQVAKIL
jgi:DNA-binding NarL/FixJ family response regulator